MIEQFTNLYPLSKNLMFKLIPQGETLENIKKNGLLTCDEKRGENYVVVKELMDRYHKLFADESFRSVPLYRSVFWTDMLFFIT